VCLAPFAASAQSVNIDLGDGATGASTGRLLQIIALLTVLSLAPGILIMVTSFTRVVVVLSLLRAALGGQQTPPNMVMVSLAMFLTAFVMAFWLLALSTIVRSVNEGYSFVVDVDLKSYFDTISHELLLQLVQRRVGDVQVLRLIRAWLKAGVMEEGKVTHPDRGSPQGGVISPTLSTLGRLLGPTVVAAQTDPLPSWNDGAAKQAIHDFVRATTDRAALLSGIDRLAPDSTVGRFVESLGF